MDQKDGVAGSAKDARSQEVLATLKFRSSDRDLEGAAIRIVAFLDQHDEALVDASPFDPASSTATVVVYRPHAGDEERPDD